MLDSASKSCLDSFEFIEITSGTKDRPLEGPTLRLGPVPIIIII